MTTPPLPDAASQQAISTPIRLMLPTVVEAAAMTTSYHCEVVIPITLKVPIVLQIEVVQQPPRCDSPYPQTANPSALLTASPVSPEPGLEVSTESVSGSAPAALASQHLIDSALQSQPDRFQLGWLLSAILRLFRPQSTLTMIVLGALLGTACSSIAVTQLLKSQGNPGSSWDVLTQQVR